MVFTAVSNAGFLFYRIFETNLKLNAEKYQNLVLHQLVQKLVDENLLETAIFQQDGAPCHTARTSMAYLRSKFNDRIISKNGEFDWAASSPDLNVCSLDFKLNFQK